MIRHLWGHEEIPAERAGRWGRQSRPCHSHPDRVHEGMPLAMAWHVRARGDLQGGSDHEVLGDPRLPRPPLALSQSRMPGTLLVLQAAARPQNEQKWVRAHENL
jgi:hypothetical protein